MGNLPDFKKIPEKLLSPKGTKLLLIAGITGIALIFLSQVISHGTKQQTTTVSSSSPSLADYTGGLEKKVKNLITAIDGVGKAEVLITFESSEKNVYQQQEKQTADTTEQTQKDGEKQTAQSSDEEDSTVIISSADGGQQALLETQLTPQVEGVVVVCEGGGNPVVQENVTEAVSTALGVSSNHVYVTKMSEK
ncbi:MAG: hypothetical protein P4L75_06235 [Clostridia bacterium]|nr:hypothetical protein [Clostridia bacterium]MDR3645563.1 hypothetical protein [Clostridia bacterium]